jgi:hypothetical protein
MCEIFTDEARVRVVARGDGAPDHEPAWRQASGLKLPPAHRKLLHRGNLFQRRAALGFDLR